MTKADIVERINQKLGLKVSESKEMLEAVLSIMKNTLESGENLKISGFGNFLVKQKKARKGRNPATAEVLVLEARTVITFKPSGVLRQAINEAN